MIPIVHNSGGPRDDILTTSQFKNRLVCTTAASFAHAIGQILSLPEKETEIISQEMNQIAQNFSADVFIHQLVTSLFTIQ